MIRPRPRNWNCRSGYRHIWRREKLGITFATEDEEEQEWLASYNLLTCKPVIFAQNVGEDDLADDGAGNRYVQEVREYARESGSGVFVICAQIEEEISELDEDERAMFLEDLGLKESGLEKLIAASYDLLGLMSFLTAGETETRAWTIKKGTKAPQAAGKIHSDFERGFIRAEVVNYKDLLECGSLAAAREKRPGRPGGEKTTSYRTETSSSSASTCNTSSAQQRKGKDSPKRIYAWRAVFAFTEGAERPPPQAAEELRKQRKAFEEGDLQPAVRRSRRKQRKAFKEGGLLEKGFI